MTESQDIEAATRAYYESLTAAERAEEEALARSLSEKARQLEVDESHSRGDA